MEKTDLIEVKIQNEALYTLKVLDKNTDELITEIANLAEGNKGLCLNFFTARFNQIAAYSRLVG
jgi:hypothetical protein